MQLARLMLFGRSISGDKMLARARADRCFHRVCIVSNLDRLFKVDFLVLLDCWNIRASVETLETGNVALQSLDYS